jgi:hypothetical protein
MKDIAPSTDLRLWSGRDSERWQEFRRRYARELQQHAADIDELRISWPGMARLRWCSTRAMKNTTMRRARAVRRVVKTESLFTTEAPNRGYPRTTRELAQQRLSAKTKQIIAVAVAHVTQYPYCIRGTPRRCALSAAGRVERSAPDPSRRIAGGKGIFRRQIDGIDQSRQRV